MASSMDPDVAIQNECMVSAGDACRHRTMHVCHKHCKSSKDSSSGDGLGHCQKCTKYNDHDRAADLLQPSIATKYKRSLVASLGSTALSQMVILSISSTSMMGGSIVLAVLIAASAKRYNRSCDPKLQLGYGGDYCSKGLLHHVNTHFGAFGGFQSSAQAATLAPNRLSSEWIAFVISNGAQLLNSILYLLLIYNFTLISMEYEWGNLEKRRKRLRCTIVRGRSFRQSYLLQLPRKVIFPLMAYSAVMHWLLGQAISTRETIWEADTNTTTQWGHSQYSVCRYH